MRIVLISEQKLLQSMLHIALERRENVEIVGEYLEGKAALKALSEMEADKRPDMVIQGLQLPDIGGVQMTLQLRHLMPEVRILAVTSQPEVNFLIPFLMSGGHGYLNQYSSDEEFYQAMDEVMQGRICLSESGMAVLEAACDRLLAMKESVLCRQVVVEEQTSPNYPCPLSEREKQVLHLYVNGYKSSEIGSILYMSVNTVETHKKRVKEKLNLTRKADLMIYAKENNLFEDWD